MDSQKFKEIKKKLRLTNQEVSDAMGVRLKTVEMWNMGLWKMPLMAEKFLYVLLSMKRDNEDEYNSRLTIKKHSDAAYRKGFAEGLEEAELDVAGGYISGYRAGHSAANDEKKIMEMLYIEINE